MVGKIQPAVDENPESDVLGFWKRFSITVAIAIMKEAVDSVKSKTADAPWREADTNSQGLPTVDGHVKHVILMKRNLEVKG
jgi:hypothetical protein